MSKLEQKFQRLAEDYSSRGHLCEMGYNRYEKLSKDGVPQVVSIPYLRIMDNPTGSMYFVNHHGKVCQPVGM